MLAHGVTAFCPTIITSGSDTYSALVPQHTPREGGRHGAAVLGLHLEGPFINPAKNGCHPVEKVRQAIGARRNRAFLSDTHAAVG